MTRALDAPPAHQSRSHHPRSHHLRPARLALAALALALAASVLAGCSAPAPAAAPTGAAPRATAEVTRGDLATETRAVGTVQYAETEPIPAGSAGVVTQLPTPGDVVSTAGGTLYTIDTKPVLLLSGTVPAWRDFAAGMAPGADIAQLEQGLLALGHFDTVPDATFGTATTRAISALQKALGVERTGTLSRSSIVFSDRDLRVDTVASRVGAQVAPGEVLWQATSTEKVVVLDLASEDRGLAAVGGTVTVTLPSGAAAEGVVASVGSPVAKPKADGSGSTIAVPVRITVADQAALADLALASIAVGFASPLGEDVLTAPVGALVPLSETAFALEVVDGGESTLLPVTVGASAAGRVEVSGDGVVEGLVVGVPGR